MRLATSRASGSPRSPRAEHERRHVDGREDVAQIRLLPHPVERVAGGGARAHAHRVCEPFAVVGVPMERGRDPGEHLVGQGERPPSLADALELVVAARRRLVVGGRMEEDQRGRPVRVGRGREARHRRALLPAEDDGALRADRVQDRAHILHARLQRRKETAAVREAGAALVEEDQPKRLREALVEGPPASRLPVVDQIRVVVGDEDEICRGVSDDVIGNRGLAAPHVPDVERATTPPGLEALKQLVARETIGGWIRRSPSGPRAAR
jgi:hypothetical protein